MPKIRKHKFNAFLSKTLLDEKSSTGTSVTVEVIPYNFHSIQVVYSSGSPSIEIRTSLNGVDWYVEQTVSEAGIYLLEGKTRYISVNYVSGTGTVSVFLVSSN